MTSIIESSWKSGNRIFLIDFEDGEAKAFLSPYKKGEMCLDSYSCEFENRRKIYYVDFVKVSPKYRNCGYGSILMEAIIKWSNISKNIITLDAIPLDSGVDRFRLYRFYHKFGFARCDPDTTGMVYKPNKP
jgi:Acetyltransferases